MIDRRTFLGTTAAATVPLSALASTKDWMMAEWAPHDACIMTWCAARDVYGDEGLLRIHQEQARIARAIAEFEPVAMMCNEKDLPLARGLCGPTVHVDALPVDDIWARDTMATFRWVGEVRTGTLWNFNAWGEKYAGYERDREAGQRYCDLFSIPTQTASIVAEGGAIETDGRGTLLTTETCLLNENRNPGMSREEVEAALKADAPCEQVVWLWGSEADFVTDGHVDGLARFIRPGLVVVEVSDDKEDPEYRDLQENALRLEAARDARGEPLEVIRLNRPRWEEMPDRGPDFAPSYLNSYFPNGGIIMPRFRDDIRDDAARDLFTELMPDRRIVQLEIDDIAEAGGGIHCCTMQVPA